MKTLSQREQELKDEAGAPLVQAESFAKDARAYVEGNRILGTDIRAIGNVVEITNSSRRIMVTALSDGRWQVDNIKLDHDDMLVTVLTVLGALGG